MLSELFLTLFTCSITLLGLYGLSFSILTSWLRRYSENPPKNVLRAVLTALIASYRVTIAGGLLIITAIASFFLFMANEVHGIAIELTIISEIILLFVLIIATVLFLSTLYDIFKEEFRRMGESR